MRSSRDNHVLASFGRSGIYMDINGEKLDAAIYSTKYYDQFSWLAGAHDGGSTVFHGVSCHKWFIQAPGTYFELLVAEDTQEPVMFYENITHATASIGQYATRSLFTEWRADESNLPHVWEGYSSHAFKYPAPCAKPSDPTPVDTIVYVFHPKNEFNISGQDVGGE